MATQHALEENNFDLWEALQRFMAPESAQTVCLIHGTAHSGKTTFNHFLTTRLWEAYTKDASSPIPVFITLANVCDRSRYNQDLVAHLFRIRGWPEEAIDMARTQLQFVLILDGYDEIAKRGYNFYIGNQLGAWNAKSVITSRPEYLGPGYEIWFYPSGKSHLLQEYWLAPFSTNDIIAYISKHVPALLANDPSNAISRAVKEYESLIEIPDLRALICNPFLLKIVMELQVGTGERLSRVNLYGKLLDHWLLAAQERLALIQLSSALEGAFHRLCEEGFTDHAKDYCLRFAVELCRHKLVEASYTVPSSRPTRKLNWGDFLTPEDPTTRLLCFSAPLVRTGNSYRFAHKSLRDFGVAQSIWQEEDLCTPGALLNQVSIVGDHGIIDFLVEKAKENPQLRAQLLACVAGSTGTSEIAVAVANAMAILARVGTPPRV